MWVKWRRRVWLVSFERSLEIMTQHLCGPILHFSFLVGFDVMRWLEHLYVCVYCKLFLYILIYLLSTLKSPINMYMYLASFVLSDKSTNKTKIGFLPTKNLQCWRRQMRKSILWTTDWFCERGVQQVLWKHRGRTVGWQVRKIWIEQWWKNGNRWNWWE
jgi:hypothetical protein